MRCTPCRPARYWSCSASSHDLAGRSVLHLPAAVLRRDHLRRRDRAAALPRRAGRRRALRVAAAGGGCRVQPRVRRGRPHPGVGRARRRSGPAGAGGRHARARYAVRARHRAQPPGRRGTEGEPVVVGRAAARARVAVRGVLRHRVGERPILLPILDADEDKALAELGLSEDRTRAALLRARVPGRARHRRRRLGPGRARAPALPAGVLEARRRRADLPAVLRRVHAGRGARGDPRDLRGDPPRGAALGGRGRHRRAPRRPPRRAVRSGRLRADAARGDRAGPLAGGREDPRRRRVVAGVLAGRRHLGLRGAARDRRRLRRSRRRRAAHPVRRRAHRAQAVAARGRARRPARGGAHASSRPRWRASRPSARPCWAGSGVRRRTRTRRRTRRLGRCRGRAALRVPGVPLLPARGPRGAGHGGVGGPLRRPDLADQLAAICTPRCSPTRAGRWPPGCSRPRAW